MLGVSGNMRVKILEGQNEVNVWLRNNPDTEIIDIKFASSATDGEWADTAMIIYVKE